MQHDVAVGSAVIQKESRPARLRHKERIEQMLAGQGRGIELVESCAQSLLLHTRSQQDLGLGQF